MGIHQGHRERMKQEFLQGGLDHFSEPRVLELLLFFSRFQGDVNPLAHRLLETFGSLSGVLDAKPEELAKVSGVGENTVVLLKLIPAIAARYLACRAGGEVILSDSQSLFELFQPCFFAARNELSYLACFDSKLRLLGLKKISEGSPNANEISVRKISSEALALNATVVVLAHNHPSGLATPSEEDIFTTRFIQNALRPLGITLYDHVILADGDMVSLRDSKYLTVL